MKKKFIKLTIFIVYSLHNNQTKASLEEQRHNTIINRSKEDNQIPKNSINPTSLASAAAQTVQSTTSSGNTAQKSNSFSCKKSSLVCAFTCNLSTCDRWKTIQ